MAATVKVWDPLVRVFHWGLVAGITVAWISADEWDRVHETTGYVVAGLIAFRLIWGVFGTHYARFTQFAARPSAVLSYLRDILGGREQRYIGHNPAGAAMILALLLCLSGTALTGWFQTIDMFRGSDVMEEIHEVLANGMLVLVALHIAGIIFASRSHSENLVRAMITGRKRRPAGDDVK
ncbi:MAG: cytochrome b/b6 domain-containing protein [Pseudomonadota bacterium]